MNMASFHAWSAPLVVMLGLVFMVFPGSVWAESSTEEALRFSYWNEAGDPWVNQDQGAEKKGILMELGHLISASLGRKPEFIKLPVARIEMWLQAGKVDLACASNPKWTDNAERYHWTPVLFKDSDSLLVKKGQGAMIKSMDDLIGRKIGVYQSYTYDPDFTRMMDSGQVEAVNVADFDKGVQLLRLGRIDAFVDFGMVIKYRMIRDGLSAEFEMAEKAIDEFDLQCYFSRSMSIKPERVNQSIKQLVDSGSIEAVLGKYR